MIVEAYSARRGRSPYGRVDGGDKFRCMLQTARHMAHVLDARPRADEAAHVVGPSATGKEAADHIAETLGAKRGRTFYA